MQPGAEIPFIVGRIRYIEGHECGYCHDTKTDDFLGVQSLPQNALAPKKATHITVGCSVEHMSCPTYDQCINMGFRRSGKFLYKGDMLRGCCRMFTIRTKIDLMKITKEHRQVVNRFKRAISDKNPSQPLQPSQTSQPSRRAKSDAFDLQSLIEAEQSSSRFHTRFESARFSKEKYELYKKYQTRVHNDDPDDMSEGQFVNFLCDLPFLERELEGTKEDWDELNSWVARWRRGEKLPRPKRIGPVHECYYFDDQLIGISFLDMLPTGVSSVYFVWDPDYAHLSLGTLLGIREVQMCHELGLGYYYLGYYIDDCPKMRYKAKFGGEILDVCNEVFIPLEQAKPLMQGGRFFALSSDNHEDSDSGSDSEGEGSLDGSDEQECDGAELCEPELSLDGRPGAWNTDIVDVSDELYGNVKVHADGAKAKAILKSEYGVLRLELPAVFAGGLPLYQIVAWFEEKTIDLDLEVSIFDAIGGRMLECTFGELNGRMRLAVIDFMRLFGLERVQEAIIIL